MASTLAPTDQAVLPIGGTFPSRENHKALRQSLRASGVSAFTDDERWHWHAYDYGWRRVQLGDMQKLSPIDPDGAWFNEYLAAKAEAYWRSALGKPALVRATPSDAAAVRPNWRTIPFPSLTEAEKELFNESVSRMRAAGRFGTPQLRRMPGPKPKPSHVSRELTGFSLEPDDSPAVSEILEQMDAAE